MKTLDRLRQLDVEAGLVAAGSYGLIPERLPLKVHKAGCRYRPAGLVYRVKGRLLDPSLFATYPNDTYAGIYGF